MMSGRSAILAAAVFSISDPEERHRASLASAVAEDDSPQRKTGEADRRAMERAEKKRNRRIARNKKLLNGAG